jgi:hypothetical protein
MIVWLVEEGEYEDRGVVGVYSSIDNAVTGIKAQYPSPYIVKWKLKEKTLIGYFAKVTGYSTKHTEEYDISEVIVDEGLTVEANIASGA